MCCLDLEDLKRGHEFIFLIAFGTKLARSPQLNLLVCIAMRNEKKARHCTRELLLISQISFNKNEINLLN